MNTNRISVAGFESPELALVRKGPIGVVAAIVPWNFPHRRQIADPHGSCSVRATQVGHWQLWDLLPVAAAHRLRRSDLDRTGRRLDGPAARGVEALPYVCSRLFEPPGYLRRFSAQE